jgi:hypothetical protein
MEVIVDILIKFWYLWALVIAVGILEVFMPRIKGFFGEKSVSFFLSRLDETKYMVINDLMLKVGSKTTQIDHVVVSNYGVFVIETKNYKGWIIGNEFDEYWKQVIYKSKKNMYNPIRQNYGHIQALKEIIRDFPEVNYIPIVVFTTKADLKVKSKTDVIYTINLLKTIKKYDKQTLRDSIKKQIYSKLISLSIDGKENRKAHVAQIQNRLIDNNNKINNDICPRCGGKLFLRKSKYGQFKGCSNYPKCRFILK